MKAGSLKLADFDYVVPGELVAQAPLEKRDASRLLVLCRKTGRIEHRQFRDLPEYLNKQDTLVLNRSKVIRARLLGKRNTGGKVEIFLLERREPGLYECLLQATANKKEGMRFDLGEKISGEVLSALPNSIGFLVRLYSKQGSLEQAIEEHGRVPLPPYINRDPDQTDENRYQTVYAENPGSVAAPTAGLHFTPQILAELEKKNIRKDFVTLHVGIGTFLPIKVENIEEHKMHEEYFEVSPALLEECRTARSLGRRIVAVGTTTVRSLESAMRGLQGRTDLFLRPGSEFLCVDAMLTNFHQPKSSLVVMVSAFVGSRELLFSAYEEAIREKYRFFSYGDAMLIL